LVFLCTFLGAGAQILMKTGGNTLAGVSASELFWQPWLLLRNLPLFGGYALYGLSTVLLVFALRKGQLSILYPIIALTYVWVILLSVIFFQEQITPLKVAGVLSIVAGVGVLGRNGQS
jgi:multidrug transporter EmrE-like cation transporter